MWLWLAAISAAWASCPQDVDGDGTPDRSTAFTRWLCVEEVEARSVVSADAAWTIERLVSMTGSDLPSDDPALALAWLRIGQAHLTLGEIDEARKALDACVRTGFLRGTCLDQRGAIDREAEAVRSVPSVWAFDQSVHGVFHPRGSWDKGTIRLRTVEGRGVLAWTTQVDAIEEDSLVLAFSRPAPAPRLLILTLRSLELDAEIEIDLIDDEGRTFAPRPRSFELPRGAWVVVEVPLVDAPPLAASGASLRSGMLSEVVLRDATGMTGVVGRSEIWIDQIEVR